MAERETLYDQLIFSGGGTRCFWQGGFMHVLEREIPVQPARITGVSGGALSACGFITHRGETIRDHMIEKFDRHQRNLPLHEPFDETAGNSPHQRIYRDVVESVLDAEAQGKVADGPRFEILIARPPAANWAALSGAMSTLFYAADMQVRSSPHLQWAEATGMTGELVDANKAAAEGRLVDLVCAAATIPPAFEPPLWNGKPAVDAGMVDQAPLPSHDRGTSLILLTRLYRNLPKDHAGRTYVEPSEQVPADKIDFTDPQKLRDTWAIGEEDARRFAAALRRRENTT